MYINSDTRAHTHTHTHTYTFKDSYGLYSS